jgi:hypothetical protein
MADVMGASFAKSVLMQPMRWIFLPVLVLAAACNGGTTPAQTPSDSGGPSMGEKGTPSAEPTAPSNGGTGEAPAAAKCGGQTCASGEQCISYYGIAGPRGPAMQECGIPCRRGEHNDGCPQGKKCVTVADGPGDVCR